MAPSNETGPGLGLAFSGGGSRAAAFHRGTLEALYEIGLIGDTVFQTEPVAVSTISGGSVFGGAWVASLADGQNLQWFLDRMKQELMKGFVWRTVRPRLLRALLPGYTRTNAMAKTFDNALFHGKTLKDLTRNPDLCLNVTVLNNGQVGKFSWRGFRTVWNKKAEDREHGSDFPLSLAVMASAAFPIGLPPLHLTQGKELPLHWGEGTDLAGHRIIALTDGGVLENLGIQTLLKSRTDFRACDIIASDAGLKEHPWKPDRLGERLMGFMMGVIAAPIMKRITGLMNDKENRHMRHQTFLEMEKTWLADGVRKQEVRDAEDMKEFIRPMPDRARRRVIMVRVDQDLGHYLRNVPAWRLVELGQQYEDRTGNSPPPLPTGGDETQIEQYLETVLDQPLKDKFKRSKGIYENMGGEATVRELNRISTGFTALSEREIDGLHQHAFWQTLAGHAVYWDP